MSFKREGNDSSLLEKLKKRRISELFSEEIPEDEAKLLCNGRFACIACPNYPIFDTVNMLVVHRKGNKHLSNAEIKMAEKEELKALIASRKHQQYLKDGTTLIQQPVSSKPLGLLTSKPYDPRVKKTKQGDRKCTLILTSNKETTSKSAVYGNTMPKPDKTTQKPAVFDHKTKVCNPGNAGRLKPPSSISPNQACVQRSSSQRSPSSFFKQACEQSLLGPIKHDHQLKDIFTKRVEVPVRLTPYQSKFKRKSACQNKIGGPCFEMQTRVAGDPVRNGIVTTNQSPVLESDRYISLLPQVTSSIVSAQTQKLPNSFDPAEKVSRPQLLTPGNFHPPPDIGLRPQVHPPRHCDPPKENGSRHQVLPPGHFFAPPPPPPAPVSTQPSSHQTTSRTDVSRSSQLVQVEAQALPPGHFFAPPPPPLPPPAPVSTQPSSHQITSSTDVSRSSLLVQVEAQHQQIQVSQKLKLLQGSGWKRDWDGKWIQDENAEFDSDEEPPNIP